MRIRRKSSIFRAASLVVLFLLGLGLFLYGKHFVFARGVSQGIVPGAQLRFDHLTVEDGLPSATVLSVMQDRDGFMWFATEGGVARYDGISFKIFQHIPGKNSISANNAFAIIQSRDGLIWIGTDTGGLNVYDPRTGVFSVYQHDPNDPYSLIDNNVWALMEDQEGDIWVGTRAGISRFDPDSGLFHNYPYDPDNPRGPAAAVVWRIYQDRAGTIWVATRNGLQRYNPASDDFTTFAHDPADPTSISESNVWAMLEDSRGNFWVGTRGGGLNLMDREKGTFIAYRANPSDPHGLSSDNIWNVFEDSAGRLWVLTETGGLHLFSPETGTFTRYQHNPADPFSLSHNDVFWMTEDRSGALWITSRYGGVNILAPMLQRFGVYRVIPNEPLSLSASNVFGILAEPDGIVWVGTFGGGLHRIDRKSGDVHVFQKNPNDPLSLAHNNVFSIHRDSRGRLWVTTSGGGLNLWDPLLNGFRHYPTDDPNDQTGIPTKYLTALEDAENDRLWVGTLGFGLLLFDPQREQVVTMYQHDPQDPTSLSDDTIYEIERDSRGQLWIAMARGGLDVFDPQTETFTHYRHNPDDPNSILSNIVHDVYIDEEQQIVWAATAAGLSRLDIRTGTWRNYTVEDGLPTSAIMGIERGESGELWVSTGRGLSRFLVETETFMNFDSDYGLPGDQFNIASTYRTQSGELFFGGTNGLVYFHPESLTPNPYKPPVVFTGFELFNKPVEVGSAILPQPIEYTEKITLSHDQSGFTIRFAALSYQISTHNLYQYKMEGFDKDWSPPTSHNQATYTNIPPGKYTFLVRAANHDGVWNPEPARLEIEILPPWWATWWFRTLSILLASGMLVGGIQWRYHTMRKRNVELEQRVRARTAELREAQKDLEDANAHLQIQLDEITALQQKVREQAIRDPLTGLYNRRYLDEFLPGAFSRAQRENACIAFVLIDLDHFKRINDTYGHAAGDAALVHAATLFRESIRSGDLACRYGGEEFLLVLFGVCVEEAMQRAEALRQALEALDFRYNDQRIQLTASIGVSIYPVHGQDQDTLLKQADEILYEAKKSGRNRVLMAPLSA